MLDENNIAFTAAPLDANYLESCWKDYLEHVVPDEAGINQIVETQHAFIAGVGITIAAFRRSVEELAGPDDFTVFMDQMIDYIANYVEEIGEPEEH